MASLSEVSMKPCLTLAQAKRVAELCRLEAERHSWKVVIAVVDDGGHLLYLERMDDVQLGSVYVAQDKAGSAVKFRRPTKTFADMVASGSVNLLALRDAVPVEGGLPLAIQGRVVGAVGVSGLTSAQDGVVAAAGLGFLAAASGDGANASAQPVAVSSAAPPLVAAAVVAER